MTTDPDLCGDPVSQAIHALAPAMDSISRRALQAKPELRVPLNATVTGPAVAVALLHQHVEGNHTQVTALTDIDDLTSAGTELVVAHLAVHGERTTIVERHPREPRP